MIPMTEGGTNANDPTEQDAELLREEDADDGKNLRLYSGKLKAMVQGGITMVSLQRRIADR